MKHSTGLVREHPSVRAFHLSHRPYQGHRVGGAEFPASFLQKVTRLQDQGQTPTCFAQAGVSCVEAQRPSPLLDPIDLARECCRLDGTLPAPGDPLTDGSTATTLINVLRTRGVCRYRADDLVNLAEQSAEDAEAVTEAPDNRFPTLTHEAIDPGAPDLEAQLKHAIVSGLGVLWGTPTTAALQTLEAPWFAHDGCFEGNADGHMIRIIGYVAAPNGFDVDWYVQNWWAGWGGAEFFPTLATLPQTFVCDTSALRLAWSLDAIGGFS